MEIRMIKLDALFARIGMWVILGVWVVRRKVLSLFVSDLGSEDTKELRDNIKLELSLSNTFQIQMSKILVAVLDANRNVESNFEFMCCKGRPRGGRYNLIPLQILFRPLSRRGDVCAR